MRLDNAAIVSGENRILVTAGWIVGVHRDRRKSKGEVRVGDSARRRKPPSEVADLVGTGRLWVARGEFEILETDAKRHTKGVTMRLVVGDLLMYVVSLTPLELAGQGSMRWAFRALFVPTDQQLARLPVEELTRPSHATLEEQAFMASQQLRDAPIVPKPAPTPLSPANDVMLAPAIVATTAVDIDLQLEFDDSEKPQAVKPDNSEKAALMAYLQSLAYPEDTSN
ncbi:MAG: hypothetical protein ACK41E_01645 [Deinococcales bacterium]